MVAGAAGSVVGLGVAVAMIVVIVVTVAAAVYWTIGVVGY